MVLKLTSNRPQSEYLYEQKDSALFLMLWLAINAIFLIDLELGFLPDPLVVPSWCSRREEKSKTVDLKGLMQRSH